MSVGFDNTFLPRFAVLFKDERSESVNEYCYPGAVEGGFVDGVSIEVIPDNGKPWFASFAEGTISPNAVSVALAMPGHSRVMVISRGEAYIVDVDNPQRWEHLELLPVMGWAVSSSCELVLLWDFSRIVAYGEDGLAWKTPSISWDGLLNLAINDNEAIFRIWNAPTGSHESASVDLRTGVVRGGASPELVDA